MHRRIWFLVAAAVAVFALTGSAAASSHNGAQSRGAQAFGKLLAANRTPQQRMVNDTVAFAMEQDAGGFNLANENFTGAWAAYFGETPVIRGNYTIDDKGKYLLDLAKSVTATKKTLDIVIKDSANWNWIGHTPQFTPVTAQDYIYTWQQFIKPNNLVASTVGYNLIYNATVKPGTNNKEVIFYWHKPFADFKDLFGYIYPSFAVSSKPWNQIWANCVCGYVSGNATGPITDGPYYLQSWTPGSGLVLKSNANWYGQNPAIHTIIGKLYNDEGSEIQAMSGNEVDAIYPGQPISSMTGLLHKSGVSHVIKPGFIQEHIDVEFGAAKSAQGGTHSSNGAALLKHSWFTQSLAQSLNRQSVANAIYGAVLSNNSVKPLNNPFYTIGGLSGGQYAFFKPFNYNPNAAVKTLGNHCHGGPKKANPGNISVWSCGGVLASINFYTTTAPARCGTAAPAWKAEAIAVGIRLNVQCYTAQPNFFTNLLPTGAFDLAQYAFVGSPDPSGWDAIYQCVTNTTGGQNYKNYCNHKVDKFIKLGDSELTPAKRTADYENAAKLVSNDVAIIPLYARPAFLFYNSSLNGLATADNPTSVGPLWHAEGWSWGS